MKYTEHIGNENKTPTGVLMFDKYTIGNVQELIKNSQLSYFPSGSAYADVPIDFFFDEFFERFNKKIKYISLGPMAYLTGVGEVKSETFYFNNLDEFDKHLEENYGYLLIYTVNKQIDTLNPSNGYIWRIRFATIGNKEDIRDEKLEDILK
jgi:hypothetical protein